VHLWVLSTSRQICQHLSQTLGGKNTCGSILPERKTSTIKRNVYVSPRIYKLLYNPGSTIARISGFLYTLLLHLLQLYFNMILNPGFSNSSNSLSYSPNYHSEGGSGDCLCGLVIRILAADPEARVRFPAPPNFLSSSGSGTRSTQTREYK
jgi:hypothetical protein